MKFDSTTQAISWFRDRYLEGTLSLKPSYQRNAVWLERQKNWLVETVLKGYPMPEVFIQITTEEDGSTDYAVVDGQQRIRSILQFVGADSDESQVEFDKFRLDKLELSSPWYGQSFADIPSQDKREFYRYQIAVRYLESDDEDEIKEMFRRLNRFTSPLRPQELRNATYGGPFAKLAQKLAEEHGDFLAANGILTAVAFRRMADVEFIAELMIGVLHGPQGGQASVIDSYYVQYEDYEDEFPRERVVRRELNRAVGVVGLVIPDLRNSRWSNKSDFYSLVVAFSAALQTNILANAELPDLRRRLADFETEIAARIENESAAVSEAAADYTRNVIRGANEKARRAARHSAILSVLREVTSGGTETTVDEGISLNS